MFKPFPLIVVVWRTGTNVLVEFTGNGLVERAKLPVKLIVAALLFKAASSPASSETSTPRSVVADKQMKVERAFFQGM